METSLIYQDFSGEGTIHCEHFHYCEVCKMKFKHNFVKSVIPFECSWEGICVGCDLELEHRIFVKQLANLTTTDIKEAESIVKQKYYPEKEAKGRK